MWRRRLPSECMENQKEFLEEIKQVVLSFDDKAEVILYGSRARGDYREDSDWDVLILTSRKLDVNEEDDLRGSIYSVELKYLQPISTMIYDKETWEDWEVMPLYRSVTKDGVRI